MSSFIIQASLCLKKGDRTAEGERGERLCLLMRVYHNDTTVLMHLSYKDLHGNTNTGGLCDALLRVAALMMCDGAVRR